MDDLPIVAVLVGADGRSLGQVESSRVKVICEIALFPPSFRQVAAVSAHL